MNRSLLKACSSLGGNSLLDCPTSATEMAAGASLDEIGVGGDSVTTGSEEGAGALSMLTSGVVGGCCCCCRLANNPPIELGCPKTVWEVAPVPNIPPDVPPKPPNDDCIELLLVAAVCPNNPPELPKVGPGEVIGVEGPPKIDPAVPKGFGVEIEVDCPNGDEPLDIESLPSKESGFIATACRFACIAEINC